MLRFATSAFRPAFLLVAIAATLVGCGKSGNAPTLSISGGSSPRARLQKLVEKYQGVKTYQDAGELRFLVDGAPEDEFRSLPFSVTFERPNKLRIHVLDTSTVADGKLMHSIVQSLPGQVLERDCPATINKNTLAADEMLENAMRGQLGVELPQLELLTGSQPLETLTEQSTPKQLGDSEFLGEKCWRIALEGPSGKSILWINQESGLLVKFEFPLEEIRKQFPLARLWAEFRGAKVDDEIESVAFQMEVPVDVKLVSKFVMPPTSEPHPMLAKPVDKFTFIALDGTAYGEQSLAGKVVVLDMWATWCGWCFEGLPLLDKVYQQYKDNDQIVFLAVSKDDPAMTNAAVEEAFKKHNLSLPIVRDQEQLTDRVFQLEGLPTTIVLGKDGTVQDYHVGYDPQLPSTLPGKLDKLLAGEDLARSELEAFEAKKREFEERLSEVLIEPAPSRSQADTAEVPSEGLQLQ